MKIWVDADAAPRPVKDILIRAAQRREVDVVLVANAYIPPPKTRRVTTVKVDKGMDVADDWIVAHCEAGDLVITADVPLAAEVVAKGAVALDPRGELLTTENVGQRLAIRDFMQEARASGLVGGGPPPFSDTDRQRFANALDRWITAALRSG